MCLSGISEYIELSQTLFHQMKRHILTLPPGGLATVRRQDRPRYRLALLVAANLTYDDLAKASGKSSVYIGLIINDQRTGYKVRPIIAQALGFQVTDLWPDTPGHYREAA